MADYPVLGLLTIMAPVILFGIFATFALWSEEI